MDTDGSGDEREKEFVQCMCDAEPGTNLLSCFHPVCDRCLSSPGILREDKIICGKCDTVTNMTSNSQGIGGLSRNYFQEIWARYERLFDAKPCVACAAQGKTTMGTHVCLDCGENYLCTACLPVHTTVDDTMPHKPVPIQSLKDPGYSRKLRARHRELCTQHDAIKRYYCLECQSLFCNDCLQVGHTGHKRMIMASHCDKQRENIASMKKKLERPVNYALWQEAQFNEQAHRSSGALDEDADVKKKMAERVGIAKQLIDEWGNRQSAQLRAFHRSSRQQYEAHAAHWKAASVPLRNLSSLTNLCLQYASDHELPRVLPTLKGSIGGALKQTTESPPLMLKTRTFLWESLENIQAKLDDLIGTIVEKKSSIVKYTESIGDIKSTDWISGLALSATPEGEILATGRFERGVYVFERSCVAGVPYHENGGPLKRKIEFQEPIRSVDIVAHCGQVYVSDSKLRQVKRLGEGGNTIKLRGNEPGDDDTDRIALSVDSERGLLYCSSRRKSTVYRCTFNDEIAEPLIQPSSSPSLHEPLYIHVTHTGDLVVSMDHSVHIYDPDGQLKHVLGEKGEKLGQFDGPRGVGTDASGYMYVAEWGNHRVQVIAPDHSFLGSFPEKLKQFQFPNAVIVTGDGDVWVSHSRNKIRVFRPVRRLPQE